MHKKVKIACISKGHHPETLGGIETFQRNLTKLLDKYNFRIYSYPTEKEKIYYVKGLITIGENNFLQKFLLKVLGRKKLLYFLLKSWKPDIIIINSANDLKFLKNFKVKIILVQHGSFEYYLNGTFNKPEVLELIRERLDKYIFLSPYDLEKFNCFLNLAQEKIKVIRHICNLKMVDKFKEKEKSLIIISRLDKNKGISNIVKAMRKLKEFSLKIYGDGESDVEENLKDIVNGLKLSNVKLMGRTNKVAENLDKEKIFILNSDFEGYPISCIEAMRRGLPIILRNTFSSAKDIVQGNGVLLKAKWNEDEFVEAVYNVYSNYEEYSEKSLELGKRYDIEEIKKEWENLIEELIK